MSGNDNGNILEDIGGYDDDEDHEVSVDDQ